MSRSQMLANMASFVAVISCFGAIVFLSSDAINNAPLIFRVSAALVCFMLGVLNLCLGVKGMSK